MSLVLSAFYFEQLVIYVTDVVADSVESLCLHFDKNLPEIIV